MSGNLPSEMNNYANSAMVSMPLYEVDMLRSDLIKANAENAKLKEIQKQVVVRLEKEIITERTVHSNNHFGSYRIDRDSNILENIRMINLDELNDTLKAAYEKRLNDKLEILQKNREEKVEKIEKKFKRLEKNLHEKYNAEKIDLLESELENAYEKINSLEEIISMSNSHIIELNTEIALYKPAFEMVEELSVEYLEYNYSGVFEKYIKGFYKKVDKIINKFLKKDEDKKADSNN